MLHSACQEMVEAAGDDEKELAAQMAAEFLNEDLAEQQFGAAKAGPGMWASILRMLDPIKVRDSNHHLAILLRIECHQKYVTNDL